jgi:hypothetical protein
MRQDRDEPGLPVVAVHDIGALISGEHELERRLREKREPFPVVCVPTGGAPRLIG